MSLSDFMKSAGFLIILIIIAGCERIEGPTSLTVKEQEEFSPKELVSIGEKVIFGTDRPTLNESGRLPIGKGQCAFCHMFVAGQKADRCPDLRGVEARSHQRPKEARYRMFAKKYTESGEPKTGIRPHAKSGGQYLIESLYCPNCYVVEGRGRKGTNDMESEMPIVLKPPMKLTDYEVVAVVAYLQAKESPGDYTRVTAVRDWERFFGAKLSPPPEEETHLPENEEVLKKTALTTETLEEIIEKMRCFVCHKIPTIPVARTGVIGPMLVMKTNASIRIKSPAYQEAVREGRARATTPKEYVVESILHPSAFVLEGFRDNMPQDYERKFTVGALEKLVDFLLTIDEETVLREEEELDRLESELEEDSDPSLRRN